MFQHVLNSEAAQLQLLVEADWQQFSLSVLDVIAVCVTGRAP